MRNTIERAVILCGEGYLSARDLPPGFGSRSVLSTPDPSPNAVQVEIGTTVDEAEKRLILRTLESTQNNKTRAAEILGISLKTMHNKLKEYGAASAAGARAPLTLPRSKFKPGGAWALPQAGWQSESL